LRGFHALQARTTLPVKPNQTKSNQIKPARRGMLACLNDKNGAQRTKGTKGTSGRIKRNQGESNQIKPAGRGMVACLNDKTGRKGQKGTKGTSDRIKPNQGESNQIKPNQTCGVVCVSRNWTIRWGKTAAKGQPGQTLIKPNQACQVGTRAEIRLAGGEKERRNTFWPIPVKLGQTQGLAGVRTNWERPAWRAARPSRKVKPRQTQRSPVKLGQPCKIYTYHYH
jgi:hypothetical protein